MRICLIFVFFLPYFAYTQSDGLLNVEVTTSHAGGNYKPKNIVAIWIENDMGDFVKTLLVYGDKRRTHLNTWQASTNAAGVEYNKVDAISGATKNSHGTRTCTWDGHFYDGEPAPDGTYKLWMELTDKNSTGNYSSVSFTKGSDLFEEEPVDQPSFSDIQIKWEPATSHVTDQKGSSGPFIYPNPATRYIQLSDSAEQLIRIIDMDGKEYYRGKERRLDIQYWPSGLYYWVLDNNQLLPFIKQ
jgi:hypothetical protein